MFCLFRTFSHLFFLLKIHIPKNSVLLFFFSDKFPLLHGCIFGASGIWRDCVLYIIFIGSSSLEASLRRRRRHRLQQSICRQQAGTSPGNYLFYGVLCSKDLFHDLFFRFHSHFYVPWMLRKTILSR